MSKTTILFFASNPDDTFPLNLAEEVRQIEQSIRAAEYRDHINFRSKWAVQAKDLLDELDVYKPPVVHFSGHGDQNGIFLHDASGKSKLLPVETLKRLLGLHTAYLHVIVLNSCLSAAQAEELSQVVDCVVGMSDDFSDEAARIFSSAFYSGIGFGRSVKDAFDKGVVALLIADSAEAETPQIFEKPGTHADWIRPVVVDEYETISTVNLQVASAVEKINPLLSKADGQRKQAIVGLFRAISDVLFHAVGEFRSGRIPTGDCAQMECFAEELYGLIHDVVGHVKADALRGRMRLAHHIERAVIDLTGGLDSEQHLAELEKAAGIFAAEATLLQARF